MFGPSRRVSRRTARRTSRRMYRRQAMFDSMGPDPGYDEYDAGPPPAPEPDVATELTKLAALRDQGVLTDAEFEAKKKQMLGI